MWDINMIYLFFCILLLIGIGFVFLIDRAGCVVVKATVMESRERLLKKNGEISEIKIEHALSYSLNDEEKIMIVDTIPVRETNGSVIRLKLDKKTLEPAEKAIKAVLPAVLAMSVGAFFCLYLFLCSIEAVPAINFSGISLSVSQFAFAFPVIVALILCGVMLSDPLSLLNPGIIKVTGHYEGIIHSGNFHRMTKYYSLWYGEFRQYACCIGGPIGKTDKTKPVKLFYNTKTGKVRRKSDVIRNACLGTALLVLTVVYIAYLK